MLRFFNLSHRLFRSCCASDMSTLCACPLEFQLKVVLVLMFFCANFGGLGRTAEANFHTFSLFFTRALLTERAGCIIFSRFFTLFHAFSRFFTLFHAFARFLPPLRFCCFCNDLYVPCCCCPFLAVSAINSGSYKLSSMCHLSAVLSQACCRGSSTRPDIWFRLSSGVQLRGLGLSGCSSKKAWARLLGALQRILTSLITLSGILAA